MTNAHRNQLSKREYSPINVREINREYRKLWSASNR